MENDNNWFIFLDFDPTDVMEQAQPVQNRSKKDVTEITRLFGTHQKSIHHCLKCNSERIKKNILLVCNLLYPTEANQKNIDGTFASILKHSLTVEKTTPAWCEKCNKFNPTNQKNLVTNLPEIISINCGLEKEIELDYLKKQMNRPFAQVGASSASSSESDSRNGQPGSSSSSNGKMCRYGMNCSRVDCHFSHPK